MRMLESIALELDVFPLNAVLRTGLGAALLPVHDALVPAWASRFSFPIFFLMVLLALRAGPLVGRKVLRFSSAANATWSARRRLARTFDSYQWQKLFWIGLGLAGYQAIAGYRPGPPMIITIVCTVGGAAGLLTWLKLSQTAEASRVSAA